MAGADGGAPGRRPFDAVLLEQSLPGRPITVLGEVGSTNDYLLARAGELPDGAVVLAEEQAAGRGRRGRSWVAPRSAAVLMSILVKDRRSLPPEHFVRLTHIAGVAVAGGVEGAQIKWPNDVLLGGAKLAGILVESDGRHAVVGIGVNVDTREDEFPEELDQPATSLRIAAGRPVDRDAFVCALVRRFDAWLDCPLPFGAFVEQHVKPISYSLGKQVEFVLGDGAARRGTVVDLSASGELLVACEGGGPPGGVADVVALSSVDQVRTLRA